jgi:hypothetical protein
MTALEIRVNGEKVCAAGKKGLNILSAAVTWLKTRKVWDFRVRGVTGQKGFEEHLNWLDRQLGPGDSITIAVVETNGSDEPQRRYRVP